MFSSDGTPLRGITNVSSQFSLGLGFPGKKYIRVSEIAQEGKKADLWIETGNNDLFGNLRTGTVGISISATAEAAQNILKRRTPAPLRTGRVRA